MHTETHSEILRPFDTALMQRIEAIDLSMVKKKLQEPEEGEGWTTEFCDQLERIYKRYLYLAASEPAGIVPFKEVDTMWHYHILDTRAYERDCHSAFGRFLHHFPYFGLRGEEDKRNLKTAFAHTSAIYTRTFSEAYTLPHHHAAGCGCEAGCSGCGTVQAGCDPGCGSH